ncbi:MAG: NAD(P)/FAD-dependent oxidoreductase [Candidatus Bathyarchaeia archaeon]
MVVGAGPAGNMAAKTAADEGLNVILIEEHPKVGVPLYCAEGISIYGLRNVDMDPEPGLVSQEIDKAKVYAPNGSYIDITGGEWVGYTINRPVFDRTLAERAIDSGAKMMLGTRAIKVIKNEGKIVGIAADQDGDNLRIKADIVIGADGHSSVIRRSAGLARWFPDVVSCAQYRLKGVNLEDANTSEFWIGEKYAPGGYAWVFPKSKDTANIGLGVRERHLKPAIEYLKDFIDSDERFKDARIIERGGGICPVSGILDEIVADGLMLVGDAAGELIPCTGAGIHTATEAGKIAGRVAAEAVSEGNPTASRLSEYRMRFEDKYGKKIEDSYKVVKMLDKFSDEDLNMFADMLTGEDIVNLTNGVKVNITLARLLKRGPLRLMKLIKAYIR